MQEQNEIRLEDTLTRILRVLILTKVFPNFRYLCLLPNNDIYSKTGYSASCGFLESDIV